MAEPPRKIATYEDLYRIPENMIGEIIDGELVVAPRPSPEHSNAASSLGGEIVPPYRFGRGGPGGMDHPFRAGNQALGKRSPGTGLCGLEKRTVPGMA